MTIDETPQAYRWKGRDIHELSREELLDALEWCMRDRARQFEMGAIESRAKVMVAAFKSGASFA